MNDDLISRQAAIDSLLEALYNLGEYDFVDKVFIEEKLRRVPSIQFEKEIAKRVLWTGWKGFRDTRYKCPNCKKPVKNDDVYCHRCGQKLMFPHIFFTDYIPGKKQEIIVRWDDELGEWVYGEYDIPHCSICGHDVMPNMVSPYCPNCGAKMEE